MKLREKKKLFRKMKEEKTFLKNRKYKKNIDEDLMKIRARDEE